MISELEKLPYSITLNAILKGSIARELSGIYAIECAASKSAYIGSSRNIYKRFHQHRCALRAGRHRNEHLGSEYCKYGEASFTFSILELCPTEQLIDAENRWMKSRSCAKLLNIHKTAGYEESTFSAETRRKISDGLKARWQVPGAREAIAAKLKGHQNSARPFTAMRPDGVIITGFNLNKFCRENNLNGSTMSEVLSGKRFVHRGWKRHEPHPDIKVMERGVKNRGTNNWNSILTEADVVSIRERHASGERRYKLAREYGCDETTISAVVVRRTWKYLK